LGRSISLEEIAHIMMIGLRKIEFEKIRFGEIGFEKESMESTMGKLNLG